MKKTTIKDIAKIAGVSTTTVSMVLNDKALHISEQTKIRIKKLAQELNYKPNAIARGLVTKKTNTISLIVPDIANPYFPELARGVEDVCSKEGYHVILCNSDNDVEKEREYIDLLKDRYVDGMIFTSSIEEGKEYFDELIKENMPFIVIDRKIKQHQNCCSIFSNGHIGAYMAIKHLLEKGYRKIGMISGPNSLTARQRIEGYKQALEEYQLPFDETLIKAGDYKFESGFQRMNEFLDEMSLEAVFAANDVMALGAMKALHKRGHSIPKDMAVIGYDNIPLSEAVYPELTTIHQNGYEIGTMAAQALLDLLQKNPKTQKEISFQPKLIVREST